MPATVQEHSGVLTRALIAWPLDRMEHPMDSVIAHRVAWPVSLRLATRQRNRLRTRHRCMNEE